MIKNSPGIPDAVLSTSFIGLVFSLTGWAFLEAWLLAMQASLRGHLLATAAGLSLVVLSVRPLPLHGHKPDDHATPAADQRRSRSSAEVWSALFLFAMGSLVGLSILAGTTFALFAVAGILSFLPWSRLALCRNCFLTACSIMWGGTAATAFVGRDAVNVMFLPLASWIFWICVCIALLLRRVKLRQAESAAKPIAPDPDARLLQD